MAAILGIVVSILMGRDTRQMRSTLRNTRRGKFIHRLRTLCALCLALPALATAQTYPTRPVRVIVMSTPSSGPDILARLLNPKFSEAFGQSLVIDNRAGAAGIIGAEIGAKAAPDGHTLTVATSQVVIVSVMYDKLPFDLHKDFAPISLLGSTPFIMVVNPSVPAKASPPASSTTSGR